MCLHIQSVSAGNCFQDLPRITIRGCPSPLYTVAQYLHVTCAHPPVYFESWLVYLEYLTQWKGYGSSRQRSADSRFAFGNFWNFFSNIFNLRLNLWMWKDCIQMLVEASNVSGAGHRLPHLIFSIIQQGFPANKQQPWDSNTDLLA